MTKGRVTGEERAGNHPAEKNLICGKTRPGPWMSRLLPRLYVGRLAIAALVFGGMNSCFGALALARNDPVLNPWIFFALGGLLLTIAAGGLAWLTIVIPWRTIAWFRYDQKRLEYRRRFDREI